MSLVYEIYDPDLFHCVNVLDNDFYFLKNTKSHSNNIDITITNLFEGKRFTNQK